MWRGRKGRKREGEREQKGEEARAFSHEKGHHSKLSLHHPKNTDALPCDSGDRRHNQQDKEKKDFKSPERNKNFSLGPQTLLLLREERDRPQSREHWCCHRVLLSGLGYQWQLAKLTPAHFGGCSSNLWNGQDQEPGSQ